MTAPPAESLRLREIAADFVAHVQAEVLAASVHRQMYRDVRDAILRGYPRADSTFLWSYAQLWSRNQLFVIRRCCEEGDTRVKSLWSVLERVRRNPQIAHREFYLAAPAGIEIAAEYRNAWRSGRSDAFTDEWGSSDTPDESTLDAIQADMRKKTSLAKRWVDRMLAHADARGIGDAGSLTYGAIDDALDTVAGYADRLALLLGGSPKWNRQSVALIGDWREPLRASLWPDESH